MSERPWHVLVVVPANDEEQLLPRCLEALERAAERLADRAQRCLVVVVADACADRTARRARRLLGRRGLVVEVAVRNVGLARAVGVRHGLRRMGGVPAERVWLANTDADTVVPHSWLRRQLGWANRGVAGVAGAVRVDSFAEHPPGVAERFTAGYAVGPVHHPHVHGANLGVRADAYLAVSGWPGAARSEDHGLWDRLRAEGWPVVSDSGLWVTTSGRRDGRARGGFADTLAAHALGLQPGGRPAAHEGGLQTAGAAPP